MERASIATVGCMALMLLINSRPDPFSSERSTTATSGFIVPMISNACGSLAASPQTSKSGCWLIRLATPSRTSGWSSTSRILIFGGIFSVQQTRQRASDSSAARGQPFDVESGANQIRAVSHGAQPRVRVGLIFPRRAGPVVRHGQYNFIVGGIKTNVDLCGLAMLDRIGHRLLRDAEQVRGDRRILDGAGQAAFKVAGDLAPVADAGRQLAQARAPRSPAEAGQGFRGARAC